MRRLVRCVLSFIAVVAVLPAVEASAEAETLQLVDSYGLKVQGERRIRMVVDDTFQVKQLVVIASWPESGAGRISRYELQPFPHLTNIGGKSYPLNEKVIQSIGSAIISPKIHPEITEAHRQMVYLEFFREGAWTIRKSVHGTDEAFRPVVELLLKNAKVKYDEEDDGRLTINW